MTSPLPKIETLQYVTRRTFLRGVGQFSLGAIAFAAMGSAAAQAPSPLAPRSPSAPSKVRRVIYLHMSGGPPHLDLFDYKPELVKWNGQDCPDEFLRGRKFAFTSGVPNSWHATHLHPTWHNRHLMSMPFRTCTTWPTNSAS